MREIGQIFENQVVNDKNDIENNKLLNLGIE